MRREQVISVEGDMVRTTGGMRQMVADMDVSVGKWVNVKDGVIIGWRRKQSQPPALCRTRLYLLLRGDFDLLAAIDTDADRLTTGSASPPAGMVYHLLGDVEQWITANQDGTYTLLPKDAALPSGSLRDSCLIDGIAYAALCTPNVDSDGLPMVLYKYDDTWTESARNETDTPRDILRAQADAILPTDAEFRAYWAAGWEPHILARTGFATDAVVTFERVADVVISDTTAARGAIRTDGTLYTLLANHCYTYSYYDVVVDGVNYGHVVDAGKKPVYCLSHTFGDFAVELSAIAAQRTYSGGTVASNPPGIGYYSCVYDCGSGKTVTVGYYILSHTYSEYVADGDTEKVDTVASPVAVGDYYGPGTGAWYAAAEKILTNADNADIVPLWHSAEKVLAHNDDTSQLVMINRATEAQTVLIEPVYSTYTRPPARR